MAAQPTFSDLEMQTGRPRQTRRSRFLAELDAACPWAEWAALVAAARRADAQARGVDPRMGRPREDDLVMLRMYMVQVCFGLSDLECEEQVWDSAAMRSFVGVAPGEVPDATTLCKFRHLLESCGVGEAMLAAAFASAAEGGLAVSRGTIVDATFVEVPSSTKNASGSRDPEAHSAKKGRNWHFGYKLGVGVDAATGVPHSVRVDAANVCDLDQLPDLVREGDEAVWADAGYTGVARRPEVEGDPRLAGVAWLVAGRRSSLSEADLPGESAKSAVRCAVEHVFHVVKGVFGLRYTRLRGRAKVSNLLAAAVAAAGALAARRGPRPYGPPAALSAANQRAKLARHRERQARRAERAAQKAEREARRAAKAAKGAAPAAA